MEYMNQNETEHFFENYFSHNKEIAEKGYSFKVYSQKDNQIVIEEKKYIDISYVNFWIDKNGDIIYKVHMRNGNAYDVDNESFNKEYCPHGVNVISEVYKREYL